MNMDLVHLTHLNLENRKTKPLDGMSAFAKFNFILHQSVSNKGHQNLNQTHIPINFAVNMGSSLGHGLILGPRSHPWAKVSSWDQGLILGPRSHPGVKVSSRVTCLKWAQGLILGVWVHPGAKVSS